MCVMSVWQLVAYWLKHLAHDPVVMKSESRWEQVCFQFCFQILLITPSQHTRPAPCNGDLASHLSTVPILPHVTRDLASAEDGQDPLPVSDAA